MNKVKNNSEVKKQIIDMEYSLIAEFIQLRKDAHLTQQEIADQSEVIRTTVARIENKMNSPQVRTMLQILEPLGYTLKIEKIKYK